MMSKKTDPSPLVLGYDDGGDMFPAECERLLRAYLKLLASIAADAGEEPLRYQLGPLHITTPIRPDPARVPVRRERWRRNAVPAEPTSEGVMRMTFSTPGEAVIVASGRIVDVVTDGAFKMVDATCIWGAGDWPAVSIVVYRVGKSRRWAYAARFAEFYEPVVAS